MTYQRALQNWLDGLWNRAQLKQAYAKGVITKEEYKFIVAQPQAGHEHDSAEG